MEARQIQMVAEEASNAELVRRGVQNYLAQEGTFDEVIATRGIGFNPVGVTASLVAFGARCLAFGEEEIIALLTKLSEDGVI